MCMYTHPPAQPNTKHPKAKALLHSPGGGVGLVGPPQISLPPFLPPVPAPIPKKRTPKKKRKPKMTKSQRIGPRSGDRARFGGDVFAHPHPTIPAADPHAAPFF